MVGSVASFRAIWNEAGAVAERHAKLLSSATTALVLIDLVTNLLLSARLVNTIGNVISIIAAFVILGTLLRADGITEHQGSVPAYFLATLLSGLAIVLGLIALIVPGFYLLARWSLAQPLTITRERGGIEAMRESWQLTQGSAWTLVGVFLVFGLIAGLCLVVTAFFAGKVFGDPSAMAAVGLLSVVTNAILVGSVCMTVAIYRQIVGAGAGLAGVFD